MSSRKVDLVREFISIYDLFDRTEPAITYETREIPCQISCPFHGDDIHKSARVYPDTNSMRCFYCSKTWDVIWYWAQVNDWWLEKDKLDFWRAVNDLTARFSLDSAIPKWEENFYRMRVKNIREYDQYGQDDRIRLREYYCWEFAKALHKLDKEQRTDKKQQILKIWEDYDRLDIKGDGWKTRLTDWYDSAKLSV